MVEQRDVEQRDGLRDALGHRAVLLAREFAARGVIVHEDHGVGQLLDGPLDDQPVVDDRGRYAALTDAYTVEHPVRRVEIQGPEFFVRQFGDQRTEHLDYVAVGLYLIERPALLGSQPAAQFQRGGQYGGSGDAQTLGRAQFCQTAPAHSRQTALEAVEQAPGQLGGRAAGTAAVKQNTQ